MKWSGRLGLNVLNNSGDENGDTQDYDQQIKATISLSKFLASLFAKQGVFNGAPQSINDFIDNGKSFPPTSMMIYADATDGITIGPVASFEISDGGTGYSVDDELTIVGGHKNSILKVLSVSSGVITSLSLSYNGSGYQIADDYETTVEPSGGTGCKINITNIYGEPWFFSSSSPKPITFSITNAPGNQGVLYAQIKLIPGISPYAAYGGANDFTLLARSSTMSAPPNSIRIGTGTIYKSAFTYWTLDSNIEVDATQRYNRKWTLDAESGSEDIYEQSILYFYGTNGIKTNISQDENEMTIYVDPKTNGAIIANDDGLSIKLKEGGGIGSNSLGLFISHIGLQFNLNADTGTAQSIISKDILNLEGSAPLSITMSATDVATIGLGVSSSGGLEVSAEDELTLKLDADGKLSKDEDGLYSQLSSFSISGNEDNSSNVIQEIEEKEIIEIIGNGSIYSDNRDGTSGRVKLGINIGTNSGLQISSGKISIKVDESPEEGNEAIILDSNGLSLQSSFINSTYGYPTTGVHEENEFYRDKSGALFRCDEAGEPGVWSQLTIGATRETVDDDPSENYILPLDEHFNGGERQLGYRIKWYNNYDYLNEYFNNLIWIWYNQDEYYSYWTTESEFPIQMGKLYLDYETIESNPLINDDYSNTNPYYEDLDIEIISNSLTTTSHKAFWSYIENLFTALLISRIETMSNTDIDTNEYFDYTYDPFNLTENIGTEAIESGFAEFEYGQALKYYLTEPDGVDSKKIILVTFDQFDDLYDHLDIIMYCRYVYDQDGVL